MPQKEILFYPMGKKRHSLYDEVIKFLSKKYILIYNPSNKKNEANFLFKISKFYPLRFFYHKYVRKFITLSEIRHKIKNSGREIIKGDLVYSMEEIPPGKKDYILDLEFVSSLAGYAFNKIDKKYFEEEFAKPRCKAIIPWYNISKRSILETLDCTKFKHKIKYIPFGIKSLKIKKDFNRKSLNLLFVSSINNPYDFELKGGIIALEVYSKLIKDYPDLKFFIRAIIPKWVEKKYGRLPGIRFIKDHLSKERLNKLFLESDILLEPIAGNHLMLECMNFKIPGIVFDHWALPEFIINGKNGYTVDCSKIFYSLKTTEGMRRYLETHNINYLKMYDRTWDPEIINDFVQKTKRIIDDKKLRIEMSEYTKLMVEPNGKYGIKKMEKDLMNVFEDALK